MVVRPDVVTDEAHFPKIPQKSQKKKKFKKVKKSSI